MFRGIFLLYITLFTCAAAHAQKLKFEQLGTAQGLPASEVYGLCLDQKGYVWAFAEFGMVKHNGTRFVPVCRNLPPSQSSVYTVRQSVNGDTYFANSKAAIYRLEHDSAFPVRNFEQISQRITASNHVIFDLLVDEPAGAIYFSTLNYSYRFAGDRSVLLTDESRNDTNITCFIKRGSQYVLIKGKDWPAKHNVTRVLDEQGRIVAEVPSHPIMYERSAIRERAGRYYILGSDYITVTDAHGYINQVCFGRNNITMEVGPDGHVWIGNEEGLFEMDSSLKVVAHYFDHVLVSDVLFDNQDGMWVSTINQGVFHCRNIYHTFYETKELTEPISLVKKIGDRLFIGTSHGDLFVREKGRLRKLNTGGDLLYVTDVMKFDDLYIIATKKKVLVLGERLDVSKHTPFIVHKGTESGGYQLTRQDEDTIICVSVSWVYKKDMHKGKGLVAYKGYAKMNCLLEKRHGEYLVGTSEGLFLLRDSLSVPAYMEQFRAQNIIQLKRDKDHRTWMVVRGGGLYLLLPGDRFVKFSNVPSEMINKIYFNGDTVLLCTNHGFFSNTLQDLYRKASWKLLLGMEAITAERYEHQLYVATKQGLVTLDESGPMHQEPPAFYLESIFIKDQATDTANKEFAYDQNDLRFNFDMLTYRNADPSFFYTLTGPYSTSGFVSGTQLHMQNLVPGHYLLDVQATGTSVQGRHIVVPFYIRPAFWQTRTFMLLAVLFGIAAVTATVRIAFQRLKRKERQKAQAARQLAEYRAIALKAQINPHFISNLLSAVQQLIFEDKVDAANQYIAKFGLLIRYVLKYSDKVIVSLHNEMRIIDINVELEQLRFNDGFVFEKQIGPEVNPDELFVPPLILQPIIENAVWHGLLPLAGKRQPRLILKTVICDHQLVISVIDNGVGRNHAPPVPVMPGEERESKGTWLVRTWIDNLNQMFPGKGAAIRFTDLVDAKNEPAGTQVDIVFPLEALNWLYDEKDKERHD